MLLYLHGNIFPEKKRKKTRLDLESDFYVDREQDGILFQSSDQGATWPYAGVKEAES